ncbi:MAG: ATP-binding protein [Parcubacteria group bacterium]|jgi:signal transduction histidine kinase
MCDFGISLALIYYAHIPVLIICFLFGLFVLFSNPTHPVNRNLFAFILFFFVWTFNDLLQWLITDPVRNLLLARLAILEALSIVFLLFFTYAFTGVVISLRKKILLFVPALPMIILIFSDYNAFLVDEEHCNVQFGELYWYLYLFVLGYFLYSAYILVQRFRDKNTSQEIKNQIKIIISAFGFFVFLAIGLMFSAWFFVVNDYAIGDNILLFFPFCMVAFIGITIYAITKYQFLNLRSVVARMLIYTTWILIATQYFFVYSTINVILVTFTLLLSIIFGGMLLYSVKMEIQRKKELEVANEQLRELDKKKSEFISMASHQLRTPLTTMKGFIGVIQKGAYGEIPLNFKEPIDVMENANNRLIALVEDMLDVSRMELGKAEFNFEKHNINDIVKELHASFSLIAKQKNISLRIKLDPAMPEIMLDEAKMRETLSNIIDNALKYTQEGSVTICTKYEGNDVKVLVTDTGIGIMPEEKHTLFEKFSRGQKAKEIKKEGLGLGLYMGRKIVEAHGGTIHALPHEGDKGMTFVVELPITPIKK